MISLYHAGMSSCSQKVRFVLEQKEIPWEAIDVNLHNDENYSAEFKSINPKAIIPVLDDDGDLIFESNNICLYLDEKFGQIALMPESYKERAEVRTLLQLVDEQVHTDSSVCTYAMAFRERIRSTHDTDEKLDTYLSAMPDAGRREMKRQVILHGTNSSEFEVAVQRLNAMTKLLDQHLEKSSYLVGDQLTIADIVYCPYITRLDHLNMQSMWADKPAIATWYQAVQNTIGYEKGIRAFFSKEMIAKMGEAGDRYADRVRDVLAR
ncbi:MAG: glutathione S-transferase family protein [Acidiferrobacterales bacterium]|nr:glutathione S-transferase family protein [Acidiferrobacterales bacterium]